MKRRKFIEKSSWAAAGVFLLTDPLIQSEIYREKFPELAKHKIEKTELIKVAYQWPRFVGRNGARDVHGQYNESTVLKIYTDQGAMGWGLSHPRINDFLPGLTGKSVADLIMPGKGLKGGLDVMGLDFPLHDLAGVILQKPVYEMLGAMGAKETPVYSGMIYLDELKSEGSPGGMDKIMDNCEWDYNYGYRQLKIKIGRSGRWYPHDDGLRKDIEVVKMIYAEYKNKGVDLLVDANNSYSLKDTIAFLEGVGDIPIYWVEEPFKEDPAKGKKLRKWMDENGFSPTLYADGEWVPADVENDVALAMADEEILDIYLNDIHVYGLTNWIKVMPRLKKAKTGGSPHTWGDMLKTHYTAHLAAGLGNIPTIEGVTCLSEEIDYGNYLIVDGKIKVSDEPGFGMKLL